MPMYFFFIKYQIILSKKQIEKNPPKYEFEIYLIFDKWGEEEHIYEKMPSTFL